MRPVQRMNRCPGGGPRDMAFLEAPLTMEGKPRKCRAWSKDHCLLNVVSGGAKVRCST